MSRLVLSSKLLRHNSGGYRWLVTPLGLGPQEEKEEGVMLPGLAWCVNQTGERRKEGAQKEVQGRENVQP